MDHRRFPSSASQALGGRHRQQQSIRNKGFWPLGLLPLWLLATFLLCNGCQSNPFASEPAGSKVVQAAITGPTGITVNIPRRAPQPPATVAIIKDDSINYSSMVSQALESALGPGGIANLVSPDKTVLIKPNLVSNKALAVTDWHVVRALVDQIKTVNGGAAIVIADGSASNATTTTLTIMAAQGFTSANFPDVTLTDLNDTATNPPNTYVLEDAVTGVNKKVAAIIRNADVYIDMPKMKTHYHAGFTGAVKNLGIGTAPWPLWNIAASNTNKGGLHHDIRSEIVDHINCRVPDLSIMDAIQGMEGQGPASGTAVTMNLVLASKDPVALDAVACNIMGIQPSLITHLVFAANENVGVIDMDNITVTGNTSIAAVQHSFVRATPGAITPPYEVGAIPYRATTVIRPAPAAMAIDGALAEWGYANSMTVNASYQVKGTGSGFGGVSDASVKAQLLYDTQNLYLAVNVRDDIKLVNDAVGSAIANGDGVELYLSTYPEQYNASRGTTYNSQYDYHLAISYADSPQAYLLSHGKALTGFVATKVDTGDGYIIEAKIPWSNFGSPTLSPTATSPGYTEYVEMGINVAINDADTSASTVDHKLIWGNAKDSDIETNPLKIGMSYIDPPGGLYSIPTYTLTVSATNGTVTKSPNTATYSANAVVSLTAIPNAGYAFAGWSGDASGTANPSSVTMNGNRNVTALFQALPVLSSIAVSPSDSTVFTSATQQFAAVGSDQYGNPLSPQPTFTWSVSDGGTIDGNGMFAAGTIAGGPFTVTAESGGVSGTANVSVAYLNPTPIIVVTPTSANVIVGATQQFAAVANDQNGNPLSTQPTFTWSVSGGQSMSSSGLFTAGATAGGPFTVTVQGAGASGTASVTVVDNPTPTIVVTPASATIGVGATQQFSAVANDSYGNPLLPQPTFTWSVSDGGNIETSGLFTAGLATGGPYTVTAQGAGASGLASISVIYTNTPPTIATAATATPSPVTGANTALSVLGADDGGEANLTYTWTTVGTPPSPVTFGVNGTNAAKATTATFTKAGAYAFLVTVSDQNRQSTTSSVAVTVAQALTSIVVSPASAAVAAAQTQQFAATGRDQFGTALVTQPAITWGVSGGQVINASGLFTAGTSAGGPYTVTAQSGTVSGTASVSVTFTETTIYRINCGSSSAVSPFTADQYASGGTQRTVTNNVTTSGVTSPAPIAVYQSERYGNLTYTLPSLIASSAYRVRLHFAELYQTATGKRKFDVAINGTTVLSSLDIYATTGGTYRALVKEFNTTASASGQIAIKLTTVTDNATISGIEIIQTAPNNPPTIATAVAANPNPVTGTTAALSVLGADDGGETSLIYTWATTGTPPAAVTFSANGTNTAKVTTATFTKAGSYTFQATVKDAGNQVAVSSVTVVVNQTLTSVVVTPSSALVAASATQQFTATARDQFATNLATQPTFTWTFSGLGNISSSGLFTASTTAGGPYTVGAQSGAISGTASVSVIVNNGAPTIATAAAANPKPVTGTTAVLSVLGADDNGEANLTYSWATTGTPPAAVTFSANGTNAAKASTATFAKAGSYVLQATMKDQGNLTATSAVTVTVGQTATSVVVSPTSASVITSTTQQFLATAFDQFAANLTAQPTFTWSANGGGTIANTGLFTAGNTAGGPYTVTAATGSLSGTASVTVNACTRPAAPANPSVTAGNAQAALSWSAVSGATSYSILRSTTSGSGYTSVVTGLTATTYTNTGLTNGTTYYYVIAAVNACGTGVNSTQVSVTPSAGTTPCSGKCSPIVVKSGQSIQSGNLGTGAICHEVSGVTFVGGNCSNMTGRTLRVNGTTMSCSGWAIPAKINNGYCIQATAGGLSYAAYVTW